MFWVMELAVREYAPPTAARRNCPKRLASRLSGGRERRDCRARHKRFVGGVFVNERSPGSRTERLRQLSEEVSRLAATLTRLAMAAGEAQSGAEPGADTQPEIAGEAISSVIRARRRREHHLPRDIFADPAWTRRSTSSRPK